MRDGKTGHARRSGTIHIGWIAPMRDGKRDKLAVGEAIPRGLDCTYEGWKDARGVSRRESDLGWIAPMRDGKWSDGGIGGVPEWLDCTYEGWKEGIIIPISSISSTGWIAPMRDGKCRMSRFLQIIKTVGLHL